MRQTQAPTHSVRKNLVPRPLSLALGALGYGGQVLLLAAGSAWMASDAWADVSASCSGGNPQVCTFSSSQGTLAAPLTISNISQPQQITNTVDINFSASAGAQPVQHLNFNAGTTATLGGNPVSGVLVLSQGTAGSYDDDQSARNGGNAQGAMLTNNASIVLDMSGSTSSGMVTGVGVSSVGGDGYSLVEGQSNDDGGNGGQAGSTTLVNSSSVQITGGNLGKGVMGALAESRGGNGGVGNYWHDLDSWGGNGGNAQAVEADNYASVSLGTSSAYLEGGVRAWGVAAQSVGGDGAIQGKSEEPWGNGGYGGNATLTNLGDVDVFLSSGADASDGVVGLLARSLGGQGADTNFEGDNAGNGGDAQAVTLTSGDNNLGNVTNITVGLTQAVTGVSAGIVAQSIAGNGGQQQYTNAYGGDGGNAGAVTVDLYWTNLTVTGDKLSGVVAASLGGNGGSDTMDSARTDGGNGGFAHDVNVTLTSKGSGAGQQTSISTNGYSAIGISAQSIGGYGGSAVKTGGQGQDGAGAKITADVDSVVSTVQDYSIGMLAQSIGGGGGTGEDFDSSLPGNPGNGGNGGSGGSATINSSATVTTQGQQAYALIAQSIGGSGGVGAMSDGVLALGSDGGAGGSGGTVTVVNGGVLNTGGFGSIGVLGQSIGGGGGAAGSTSGLFSIGGSGGAGGSDNSPGGGVTLTNNGSVTTLGDGAVALLGQSIGGGGGNGASAVGVVGIGGSGGGGGDGNTVTLDANGTQQTSGKYAYGAVAQSIGGGGGNGGSSMAITTQYSAPSIGGSGGSGGQGGAVTLNMNPASGQQAGVKTSGDGATGVVAQSIGGGGGNGGSATQLSLFTPAALAIGGSGGSGGSASTVTVQTANAGIMTGGSSAPGMLLQSIGGGGGSGGDANSFDVNVGVSVGIAVGGSGGVASHGDTVSATLSDTQISTAGIDPGNPPTGPLSTPFAEVTDSYGLLAQSIGGGGGHGGSAVAGSLAVMAPVPDGTSFAIASSVTVGGSGGAGGTGGEVDVTLSGNSAIYTGGQGSHGMLAQSIGGGGGAGGDSKAMSRTVAIPDESIAVNVTTAVGGTGGAGGNASTVNLTLNDQALVTTYSDYSNAVMGQSIGGGGGNAGVGSSGSGGVAQGKSITADVGVGGKGGAASQGGAAQVTLAAATQLTTYGSGSRGVLLQSIGGGGGASQGVTVDLGAPFSTGGGSDDAASADTGGDSGSDSGGATKMSATVSVSVGRRGSGGGDGGTVTATANGTINTSGNDADGMLLQTIGGSGGLGGSAGSDASAGPSSYPVNPDDPDQPSNPDDPGGSGSGSGSGGSSNPDDPDAPPSDDTDLGSYGLSVGVGGKGGVGGDGGAATLNYAGVTTTRGDLADGIVVQSIGGGGGVGGTATAKGAKGDGNIEIAVGGEGGVGGDGGAITLNMLGTIESSDSAKGQISTHGNMAYGLLAQSIGGGGGQGADGSADITYKSSTSVPTSILLGVNGSGGNGGRGGAILMNAENSKLLVMTSGKSAHGVVLQSIGGGGGVASLGSSASISGSGLSLSMGGGGTGSASGGGDITVNTWLNSSTTGAASYGFVAQSIGGGGGIAAVGSTLGVDSVTLDNSSQSNAHDVSGGKVNVTFNASGNSAMPQTEIYTAQSGAHGIVLQSIGGGGGLVGNPGGADMQMGWQGGGTPRTGATNATGGDVTLDVGDAYLSLNGDDSYGVILQSIADGGGLGNTSQGSFAGSVYDHSKGGGSAAGAVTFTQSDNGRLIMNGNNSVAVFAQSAGNTSQAAPISITINGQVFGNDDNDSKGIWLDGGSTGNTVTVSPGAVLDAVGAAAVVQTGSGVTHLANSGMVEGSVYLSAADSDAVGLVANTGTLGKAAMVKGSVHNAGDVIVGHGGRVDSMQVTNDFVQQSGGVLHVDADFSNRLADVLSVDGTTQLGGHVQINASSLLPGRQVNFLESANVAPGATVGGASNLYSFQLHHTSTSVAASAGQANFARTSSDYNVGDNLRAVGQHLQDIWDRGGSEALGTLYAQLDHSAAGGAASYGAALGDLSPGASAAPAALATGALKGFADAMFSCPWFAGANAQTTDGNCVWGRVVAKSTHLDDTGGTAASKSNGVTYQFGAQRRIAPDWMLGVSAAYEHSKIRGDDSRLHIKGNAGYLGAVLKYETGPWTVGSSLYGSYGDYDGTRQIGIANAEAQSRFKVWSVGQQFRVSYLKGAETSYLKPFVNLDLIYTRMPSYQESGAGALNLNVSSADRFTAVLTPGIEVGGRIDMANGYIARPYASLGVALSSTDKWKTHAHLAGRAAGSADFQTTLETGRVYGTVTAGIQLTSLKGFDLQVQYDGILSNRARSSSGSIKANWRF